MSRSFKTKSAFSLIELSIVLIIIGLVTAAIIGGKKMLGLSKIKAAQMATKSSPLNSIDGISYWLDASAENAFLTSEKVDGGTISQWKDINPQTATKRVFSQNTENQKPVYISSSDANGLPALGFQPIEGQAKTNGVLLGTPDFSAKNNFALFFVARSTDDVAFVTGIANPSSSSGYYEIEFRRRKYLFFADGDTINSSGGYSNPTNYGQLLIAMEPGSIQTGEFTTSKPYTGVYNAGSDTGDNYYFSKFKAIMIEYVDQQPFIYVNGQLVGSTVRMPDNFLKDYTIAPYGIGKDTTIENDKTHYVPFEGEVSEVILMNRNINPSERTAIFNYLIGKWGITR